MSIRYDPLMARALAREITIRWQGAPVSSLRMGRGRRAVELAFEDGSRLVALLHPVHGQILLLEPDAPATGIEGEVRVGRLRLLEAAAPTDERALFLTLADRTGRPWEGLALELQTQRWNAVHVRKTEDEEEEDEVLRWRTEAVLLSRDAGDRPLRRGAEYRPPRSTRQATVDPPSEADWAASLPEASEDTRRVVLQTWAWTSTINVDWILAGDPFPRYLELHALATSKADVSAWSIASGKHKQPYPHPLGDPGEPLPGLLLAVTELVEAAGGVETVLATMPGADRITADGEAGRLEKRLKSRRKRLAKRVAALERQLAGAGPPDEPRALGQLLLARKADVPRGASTVTLEAFDGSTCEIELDPARDVVANAESFFDEARRRERALERLPEEIGKASGRVAELDVSLATLSESGPSDALWKLVGGKPSQTKKKGSAKGAGAARLPYTRLVSSGGLEIRVGRGAKDNDDLTFRHSAPDDIWMHASQSSGAHVILRWGRKDENPPRRDLLEAATAAAVQSGARHSGTVAVVWTRRKHVRKPRRSPPGTVSPAQAKTLFVSPDEKLVRSLRAEDPTD